MASPRDSKLWWKQTNPEEAAKLVCILANISRQRNQPRFERARKYGSMYEGMDLAGLDGDCYDGDQAIVYDGAPLVNNRAQSVADTLQAKLSALDEPRPQFVVTDGTYEQRRQAVWLDRFVEGQYYQKQGMYSTTWDMWRHGFLTAAAATGSVAVKVFPDFTAKRIVAELHNCLDMWVDPSELRYGAPLTYGESTWVDSEMLLDTYSRSQKKTQAILTARDSPPDRAGFKASKDVDTLQVQLHETWRVKTLPNVAGRYCMAVGNEALELDDYPYASPPFAFYHFRRRLGGFWGASATESFYQSVIRENQVLNRMDESEARSHTVIQYYDPGAVGSKQLSVPDHVVLIPYNPASGPPPPPFVVPWYPATAPELMRIHAQNVHDVSGVAAMQTTGTAQQGLTAAVAIRTVLSLLNERLAPRQRDIVQATAVDTAMLYARGAKELYERFGEFDSAWYGKGFVKTLPGKDCLSLPAEIFTAQVRPVSEKKNSPEDRIQLAQELVTQGVITGGHWLGILRHMDTVAAMRQFSKIEDWCEKQFDQWLYASDAEMHKPGFYVSPPKYCDLDYMMALAVDGLLSAQIDDVPDERRQLFLQFLGDLDRKIDQRDLRRQQLGLPPKQLPMPGGAPASVSPQATAA